MTRPPALVHSPGSGSFAESSFAYRVMTNEEPVGGSLTPNPSPGRPPSVWPAFIAFAAAMALALAAQFVAGMGIGVWYFANGGNQQKLAAEWPDLLASTPAFVTLTSAVQLALLATGIAAARLAPVPPRAGLGFVRPALPAWGYPALAVGSLVPLAVAGVVAYAVSQVVPPSDELERVFGRVTPGGAVPFVLFIALLPGLVEEGFFRGYVQRRLLARWPAWAAVAAAAALFGLMHVYPEYIAFASVLGLWLGAVAWRTGSVWPSALCHASINAAAGGWNLGPRFGVIPDPPPDVAVGVGAVLALGCFLASARLLLRGPSVRAATGPVEAPTPPDTIA